MRGFKLLLLLAPYSYEYTSRRLDRPRRFPTSSKINIHGKYFRKRRQSPPRQPLPSSWICFTSPSPTENLSDSSYKNSTQVIKPYMPHVDNVIKNAKTSVAGPPGVNMSDNSNKVGSSSHRRPLRYDQLNLFLTSSTGAVVPPPILTCTYTPLRRINVPYVGGWVDSDKRHARVLLTAESGLSYDCAELVRQPCATRVQGRDTSGR